MDKIPSAQLLRAAPYFPVADVEQSARYYSTVLGFQVEYSAGAPVEFAVLSRDGLAIMLRRVTATDKICPNEKQGGTWDVFFWVRNARELHAEHLGKGATIVYGPVFQPTYKMEEFAVRDADGYVLGFGQAIAERRDE